MDLVENLSETIYHLNQAIITVMHGKVSDKQIDEMFAELVDLETKLNEFQNKIDSYLQYTQQIRPLLDQFSILDKEVKNLPSPKKFETLTLKLISGENNCGNVEQQPQKIEVFLHQMRNRRLKNQNE